MKVAKAILPQLSLLLVGVIWGSSNVIIKNAVDQIPAAFLIALRCTMASALLALVFGKKLKMIDKSTLLGGAVIGLCLFLAYYMQTCSLYFSDPGKCGFLASVYCVIVPFLFWILTGKRPEAKSFAASVLCLAGVLICSVNGALKIAWGDSMALISGVLYAAHIVTIERFSRDKDPVVMTILQFAFAGLYGWIVALTTERARLCLPTEAALELMYLALVCTGLAMLLQNVGQKRVAPHVASILMSTEAVFGVAISAALGMERVTARLALGFVLIFAAILISEFRASPRRVAKTMELIEQQSAAATEK